MDDDKTKEERELLEAITDGDELDKKLITQGNELINRVLRVTNTMSAPGQEVRTSAVVPENFL